MTFIVRSIEHILDAFGWPLLVIFSSAGCAVNQLIFSRRRFRSNPFYLCEFDHPIQCRRVFFVSFERRLFRFVDVGLDFIAGLSALSIDRIEQRESLSTEKLLGGGQLDDPSLLHRPGLD